jgi:hypothetical protein
MGSGATHRAVNGVVSEFGPLRLSDEGLRCLEKLEKKFVHSAYRGGTVMSKRTAKAVAPGAKAEAPATGLSADGQRHLAQIEKKFQVVRDRVVDVDMGYHHRAAPCSTTTSEVTMSDNAEMPASAAGDLGDAFGRLSQEDQRQLAQLEKKLQLVRDHTTGVVRGYNTGFLLTALSAKW